MKPWERVQQERPGASPSVEVKPQVIIPQPPDVPGVAQTPGAQVGGGVAAATSNMVLGSTLGAEIPAITLGINALVEEIKHKKWFNEKYAFAYVVMISLFVAIIGYAIIKADPFHALTTFFGLVGNCHMTYKGIAATGTGILKPVAPQDKYGR